LIWNTRWPGRASLGRCARGAVEKIRSTGSGCCGRGRGSHPNEVDSGSSREGIQSELYIPHLVSKLLRFINTKPYNQLCGSGMGS